MESFPGPLYRKDIDRAKGRMSMEHQAGRAEVWQERVMIPTYGVGQPEKNPMFLEKRVYQGSIRSWTKKKIKSTRPSGWRMIFCA